MEKSKTHIVMSGETLAFIANKYGLTLQKLVRLNPQLEDRVMYLGQSLKIE